MKFCSSFLLAAVLAVSLAGCGATQPTLLPPHPNQVSALDGQTYDVLLGANAAITKAEQDVQAGKLPAAKWVPVINDAIKAYDIAQGSWMTYRDAVKTTPADATSGSQYQQLLADVQSLNTAVQALTGGN